MEGKQRTGKSHNESSSFIIIVDPELLRLIRETEKIGNVLVIEFEMGYSDGVLLV